LLNTIGFPYETTSFSHHFSCSTIIVADDQGKVKEKKKFRKFRKAVIHKIQNRIDRGRQRYGSHSPSGRRNRFHRSKSETIDPSPSEERRLGVHRSESF
jgi:hypothetical protein